MATYLLIFRQGLSPATFICPSAQDAARGKPQAPKALTGKVEEMSNFPSPDHLSYSYTNPYAGPEALKAGFKLDATLTSDFAY